MPYLIPNSMNPSETKGRWFPAALPAVALPTALAVLAALTPAAALAEKPQEPRYVNTQFVTETRAEESGRLVIRNTSALPRTVYARFEMPGDPGNRNYGFMQTIPPLSSIAYDLPSGVRVFACDGKYWDNYRPDEAYAVTIENEGTYRFSHSQFKPTALRRQKGE